MNKHTLSALYFWTIVLVFALLTNSCASKTSLYLAADELAYHAGLEKKYIDVGKFEILTYSRVSSTGNTLTIYIEGDGNAWRARHQLSNDPTPRNPLALKLAALDPAPNVVYLGRPCQYVLKAGKGKNCTEDYWSTGRFSEDIVAAIDQGISSIKNHAQKQNISLVGYSGGGGIAVIVASRRNDIINLRTIAANLDHDTFSNYHGTTPLATSLNAIDVAKKISHLPQIHFIGGRDKIMPETVAAHFVSHQSLNNCTSVVKIKTAGHDEGWIQKWPELLQHKFPCAGQKQDKIIDIGY